MAKRTTTLMNEVDALGFEAARLVDLRYFLEDSGHKETELYAANERTLAEVRAERDALLVHIKTKRTGNPKHHVDAFLNT